MNFKYKPIDKKRVQELIQKNQNPGNAKKRNMFKVTQTAQQFRIIPYVHHETGRPFIEVNLHYGLDGGTVICPSTYGEDCPICEFASDLWRKGEKDMAKKFFKSSRTFVPVVKRGDDTEPKFMSLSQGNYQDILNTIADPDYGDVIHPIEGRDATIIKIAEGEYGKIVIKFKPKTSPIADSEKEIERIVASCMNFDEVYPKKTYDELTEGLKKTIAKKQNESHTAVASAPKSKDKEYLSEIDKALGDNK